MKRGIWDVRWLVVVLAVLALSGCALLDVIPRGNPGLPTPSPGSPEQNPSPVCVPPGLVANCYIRPPGEAWNYLCADGVTRVTGPAECPSVGLPPTGPNPGGSVIPDEGAVMVSPRPAADPTLTEVVNAAAQNVAGCPEGPPSRCVVSMPIKPFLEAVAADVRARHVAAGIQDHGNADEVCIGSATRCQGFHVFACGPTCDRGTVAWAPGSVRDTWVGPGAQPTPSPGPTPTPDPGDATCPAGTPPPGKYIVNCHVKPANPNAVFCDATPKVVSEREYCAPDLNCPFKGGEGSALRRACERALAVPVWTGATVRDNDPFVADAPRGASVSVCARDFPGACGSTVAP